MWDPVEPRQRRRGRLPPLGGAVHGARAAKQAGAS